MTPRELFEILEDLVRENGFDAVKDTVDVMWGLLKHLDGENDFVEKEKVEWENYIIELNYQTEHYFRIGSKDLTKPKILWFVTIYMDI